MARRSAGSSAKAHRDRLRDRMRALGSSNAQIADEMARRFNLRPRPAWRHALGWTQWKLAQNYNTLHPGARLSDNRVSEYETWPHGGQPPSPRYLAGLAATYGVGCTPAQLVDADDLEHLTPADRALLTTAASPAAAPVVPAVLPALTPPTPSVAVEAARPATKRPGAELVAADAAAWATTAEGYPRPEALITGLSEHLVPLVGPRSSGTPRERDGAYDRLVQFLQSWAHTMERREILRVLGWAAATAASLPALALDDDERRRLVSVLAGSHRVDASIVEHVEGVLWHCERQDHALGPRAALDTVLAQRDLARALLVDCPAALRPRLLSAISEASRQAGWLSFDLRRFEHAGYYYEDARALAHGAENTALGAYVLCEMSHLATWQGSPRTGIDHAVAAEQWAQRADDTRLRAYAADVLARAYAADGQKDPCLAALDTAHTTLTRADKKVPSLSTYDEAIHLSIRGGCHLTLGEPEPAIFYAQRSLDSLDPRFVRDKAMTLIDIGRAHAQRKEIDEAGRLFGEAGDIAAHHSSTRLAERLRQGRAELQPWTHTTAVRQLDERLRSYRAT